VLQRKIINFFLTIVVLVYILFEELVWERFAEPLIAYINRLEILSRLERILQDVNSKLILVIFVLMFVAVEFQGIYAGALFLKGEILYGALLYAGKIPIAAFTFWLFRVTKHKLLEFGWFARAYHWLMGVIEKIKESGVYHDVKKRTAKIKAYVKTNFFQDKGVIKRKVKLIYKKIKELLNV
jgi:hypothetical protein